MHFIQRIRFAAIREKAPVILFVFSLMFFSFTYGVVIEQFRLYPYKTIRQAKKGALEVFDILTGKLPWYYRHTDRTEAVIVHRPHLFSEGLTLVSGLTKQGTIEVKVITRDGQALHRWHIDWFDEFWPNPHHIPPEKLPQKRPATHIHGFALLPNGDLVFNLEQLGMVRMTLCGDVVWRLPYLTHHAMHVDEMGNIWVPGAKWIKTRVPTLPNHQPPFWEYTLLKVAPDGEVLREISIPEVLIKNQRQGLLYMSTTHNTSTKVRGDTLHVNDVEIFPSYLQPGVFERGDIMISLRNIHAIMVIHPETLHIKYLNIGQVVRQHDPDFLDGNRLSIFDNNNVAPEAQGPQSRIVIMSATDEPVQVVYTGSGQQPFYTDIMGKHQWLPNGNILITESTKGRAFEIDPTGELVWEYFNLVSAGRLALIDEAQRLPSFFTPSFFAEGQRKCNQAQTS